nr:unnamed protein product [Digitaria exilis]
MQRERLEAENQGTPEQVVHGTHSTVEGLPQDPLIQELLQRPRHGVAASDRPFNTTPATMDIGFTARRRCLNKVEEASRLDGRSYLQAAKGGPSPMAAYPDWARCVITATGGIKRSRDELIGATVVCWLNGNSHDSDPHHVSKMLEDQLCISRHDVKVVKHYPEQYLLFFPSSRICNRVLDRGTIHSRGRVFNFAPWTERRYAGESKLKFRVHLRIELLPVHAWNETVVAQIIGEQCAIHYVEEYSRRCDRTRSYDLWAWCADPSKPVNGQYEFLHDPPADYKGAYDYKVKIHLAVVEDLLFLHGGGRDAPPNRKPRREFIWNYGVLDSQGERRDGQHEDNHHAGRNYRPCRTRRHRSSSAWNRVSRCRGAVGDCYSSTLHRGDNYGQSSYRSRCLTPPPSWGHDGEQQKKPNLQWVAKAKKRVSFANPIAQVFGEVFCELSDEACLLFTNPTHDSSNTSYDPMLEEVLLHHVPAGPTKEDRTLAMLSMPGWVPTASPLAEEELEEGELREPSVENNQDLEGGEQHDPTEMMNQNTEEGEQHAEPNPLSASPLKQPPIPLPTTCRRIMLTRISRGKKSSRI